MEKTSFSHDTNKVFLIAGMQWGDEGKGKAVVTFSEKVDIVAKYNGGHNAGHEIILNGQQYKLHLIPGGVMHPHVINVLGHGMVIHLESLLKEMEILTQHGIEVLERLRISDRAHILLNAHVDIDRKMEHRRMSGGGKIGTTLRGIGPCYSTKSARTGIRMGDLLHWEHFSKKVRDFYKIHCDFENFEELAQEEVENHKKLYDIFAKCICDTGYFMSESIKAGKKILLEGSNGSLLDIDMGTYPFVTSSTTLACGAYLGLGVPLNAPIYRIGILKCYQTRVGMGPFPTEFFDDNYTHIQKDGTEIGVSTARVRRCGWLDLVAARYIQRLNCFNSIYFTKMDVLTGLKEIKICIDYRNKVDGTILERGRFPSTIASLEEYEPVYQSFAGWDQDISQISEYNELPETARKYIEFVEKEVGAHFQWVGVGQDVKSIIVRS
ncbi:putative adenylosuccinate synthetase [Babesia bovis T2Bo]|uniref:Adenylosuccinate synthetase n=1 Tax=Babesia bovis TaxID=5865 RepID=PURA_BABBO|nr:putative adenylosuccinate synthetase [Babesia bovis T2Bo]A7AU38.1 RecName: Full=Adenylosuccinate synthetase; Short=AMPSase; Short=AdSS; AltName: Full=IMP--aspartate ligase [Babesia bovis]EDO06449.1 putative adenylosuccinate synthetase [Babesia bovis T2Bo]|eukprot:XP_001610017.1 adenylosuccinate synthetase [Babesia bovis T2Bo]